MPRPQTARPHPRNRPEDTKRAVLLSILCTLAMLLALALLAWIFWPHDTPLVAGAGGSGGDQGASTGTSQSTGTEGTGAAENGKADGATTGPGTGGDAQGDARTPGAEAGGAMAKAAGVYNGKGEPAPGDALGAPQPTAESAPAASATSAPTAVAQPPPTPPPAVPSKPSDGPDVMALGDLKFTDRSASTGKVPSSGAPTSPAFFGVKGLGTRFVYVVDRSGSMTGDRFTAACTELKKSIRSLKPGMAFHVIFYDSDYEVMPGTPLTPVTTESVNKAIGWIDQQTPRGGTQPDEAMVRALELEPHTIWLLTDGQFSDQITARIDAANPGRRTSISTVAFHDQSAEELLKRIAKDNRGDYRFVPAPAGNPLQPAALDKRTDWEKAFGKGPTP